MNGCWEWVRSTSKTTPRRRNALHDTRHIYRPFHRRKQQSPVCLYGWLQRRPDGRGAEYGGETFVGKQTALHVDCFTTVSDITARECKQLLDKAPDIVTPNGFEPNFVPSDKEYDKKRMAARRDLLNVAEKLLGCSISPDAFLVSTSGRYEYRNKGIDVFIEAMNRVRTSGRLQREVVAFIMVPAWVRDARADLKEVIDKNIRTTSPMQMPFVTHWLNQMEQDKVLNYISHAGFTNSATDKLKIILFLATWTDATVSSTNPTTIC